MRTTTAPPLVRPAGSVFALAEEMVIDLRDEVVVDPGAAAIRDLDDPAPGPGTWSSTEPYEPTMTDGTLAITTAVVGLVALLALLALWWLQVGPSCAPLAEPSCTAELPTG